jgi:uncharacterized membrane protein YtjA (UPF0391 family)
MILWCATRVSRSTPERARSGCRIRTRGFRYATREVAPKDPRSLTSPPAERRLLGQGLMLRAAIAFFVIALIAALFGFGGIAEGAADIGKILFVGFLVVAVLALVVGLVRR